jgi:glutamyl-tRNA(Gln) amidotransferase subunit D
MGGTSSKDPWPILHTLEPGQGLELATADGRIWRGTYVPAGPLSADRILQLKLASGYHVGIRVGRRDRLTLLGGPERTAMPAARAPRAAGNGGEGSISLLTTGGTIASRIDYQTGGVSPVQSGEEIRDYYPSLEKGGPVRIRSVFERLSEEVGPADWVTLANAVAEEFQTGARGVAIAHGTDTLAYTAAALAFTFASLPGPVVLVGAQRSPDRPSSDGYSNLLAAARLAREGKLGEVVLLMHAGLSDDRFAIHRATWVRKMHSSRRDAFQSRSGPALGYVDETGVHLEVVVRPPSTSPISFDARLDERGELLWFHPGLDPKRAEALVRGRRGVVIAGTGLGHLASTHLPWIRRAVKRGTVVAMTSQCLGGVADPYVYSTGRELLRAGVTYLHDLLPETAFVKLLFALGRSSDPDEVRRLLVTDWAGEFVDRREPEGTS